VKAGDVVLVTGGARGVTAECALALAQRTGARFALIGSSSLQRDSAEPSPAQQEVEATLARFRTAAIECNYYSCDVTDAEAVQQLVRQVQTDFGGLDIIVHGAGLNRPARVETVDLGTAIAEVSPKLLGAIHLVDATRDLPVRAFFALGSIIGVSGMPGNAWYAFSNEGLRAVLRRFEQVDLTRRAILADYGVWSDVGRNRAITAPSNSGAWKASVTPSTTLA
jgi:NAD(P)-dependent dehydrogenase (short-subunit alcohol dehydrogenase family)